MLDHPTVRRMPEHRCQQAVHAAGGRRGQALLEQRPAERRQMLGADIPDVHVPEGRADTGGPGLPGEQAADTGLRVAAFRGEPDIDRFGDRLLLDPPELGEPAFGAALVRPGAEVLLPVAAAAVADQPRVRAGVPGGTATPALFAEASHAAEFLRSWSQESSPHQGPGAYTRRRCSYGFPRFAGSSFRSAAEFCGVDG
jgi:hypothetical protein